MILTTTTETIAYTAPWRTDEGAPVFHLRAASVIERGQMEAELAGTYRAGRVFGFDLHQACRDGVQALLADDPEIDRLLALLDAEYNGEAADMPDADKRLLAEIRRVLAESWPAYRDLVEQGERRREIAPIVAFRRFCTGIDGKGITFTRDRAGMVSNATMAQIDALELSAAGSRAYSLAYGADMEKNLPPPSASDSGPVTSSSDAPSMEGGRSARKSGRKTPA
jgi:hypothetical protein